MSRAERRRQERENQKRAKRGQVKIPVIIAGDGIVAAELSGHTFEARPHAQLPQKVTGKHRWIASAAYVLTDLQAEHAHDEDFPKYLDHESLYYIGIGCWDCEQPLGSGPGTVSHESFCPVEGSE